MEDKMPPFSPTIPTASLFLNCSKQTAPCHPWKYRLRSNLLSWEGSSNQEVLILKLSLPLLFAFVARVELSNATSY